VAILTLSGVSDLLGTLNRLFRHLSQPTRAYNFVQHSYLLEQT